MKVSQLSVVHKNPVDGLCCFSLPISEVKYSCTETKELVASPIVPATKQKLSLGTDVQYCNSVWAVFLKSHETSEKKASSCAGLTTVHNKLSALAFRWVPIQVQFYFLSSLLLFLFVTSPTFFFPSWSLGVCWRELIQETVAYLQFPVLLEDLY